MELQLKIAGYILMILACLHIGFPKYFHWKKELSGLSLLNRQLMYVHTYFIALAVFLMGLLCVCCTEDIIHTRLGRYVSLGLFIFWVQRLFFQFFVYSPRLWKGRRFETGIHILFSIIWIYCSILFFMIYSRL
jgi:hypothetical protein